MSMANTKSGDFLIIGRHTRAVAVVPVRSQSWWSFQWFLGIAQGVSGYRSHNQPRSHAIMTSLWLCRDKPTCHIGYLDTILVHCDQALYETINTVNKVMRSAGRDRTPNLLYQRSFFPSFSHLEA